jgi:hypothetical protein
MSSLVDERSPTPTSTVFRGAVIYIFNIKGIGKEEYAEIAG